MTITEARWTDRGLAAAKALLTSLALLLFITAADWSASAQCIEHPQGRTAVRLSNESSYQVSFFLDDSDEMAFPPRTMSPPIEVEPGEHRFRARAIIDRREVWVEAVNDVPAGDLCTWTVEDPRRSDTRPAFRHAFNPRE